MMKINLNKIDYDRLNELKQIFDNNYKLLKYLHNYLFYYDLAIDKKLMNELKEYNLKDEYSFYLLLINVLNLDIEDNEQKQFLDEYLLNSIKALDVNEYKLDEYYKNIQINEINSSNWKFEKHKYMPYQGFIYDDIEVLNSNKEKAALGFFKEEFEYLRVLENGVEWMSVTPNEINTMKKPIQNAFGRVVTFGLGLGYFAYHTSRKENVKEVIIVEQDKNVINLFKENILNKFEYKNKIKIVEMDAFDYFKNYQDYDYLFIDLYHDVSDGIEVYLKFKKLEKDKNVKIDYWIEKSILSYLRRELFDNIYAFIHGQDNYLESFNYELNSYQDIIDFISFENIKKLACNELE